MNYTSIEQSKKLIELGLSPKTSDCNWQHAPGYENYEGEITGFWDEPEWGQSGDSKDLPCWSLGALLKLLREYNDCNKLDIFSNRSQKWQITISYYDVVWKEHEEININLLEAAYDTVVWLLENGYIETEKK